MSFIYPAFLYALFALAVPIIIHLFYFRSFKKILFTNVRFLKEVKQETTSRSRIKHLLVLFSRILIFTFLVLAFAQPYIPSELSKRDAGRQEISIFIDNSFSMNAVNDDGPLLEQAKQTANEIAKSYNSTDHFQLLTNDFEGRHQRLVNRDEMAFLIDETEISPASKNISEIFSRQKEALKSSEKEATAKTVFIISDFQKTICDFSSIDNDTGINVHLIPVQTQLRNNLYIDSCWFNSPVRQLNLPDEIHIRIINKSENNYSNIPIKFYVNGEIRAIGASFSVPPQSQVDTILNFTSTSAGWQNAVVEITDYPITFDDKFFLSYHIAESVRVLCINEKDSSSFIHSLFGKDPFFSLENSSLRNIDYSSFVRNNFIILMGLDSVSSGLAQELKKFSENGGSLLIFPSGNINFNSYKDFFISMNLNFFESLDTGRTKISDLNFEHGIYEKVFELPKNKDGTDNMDLPVVHKHYYSTNLTKTNEEWLMKMQNGRNFLSRYSLGSGFVYVSMVPLSPEFSSFPQHALFVPTLYQMALHSMETGKLFYTIGKNNFVETGSAVSQNSGGESIFHIVSEDKTYDFIPEFKLVNSKVCLFTHHQISKAGNYFIMKSGEDIGRASFNYDRKESDISLLSINEMNELLENPLFRNFALLKGDSKNIGGKLGEISGGIKLWKYCIILALFFLIVEIALIRWWK